MIKEFSMLYVIIGFVGFVLFIYNSFATYETLQYPKFGNDSNLKTIAIIWLVPFYGAYLANKKTGFKINIDNIDPDNNIGPGIDHDIHS